MGTAGAARGVGLEHEVDPHGSGKVLLRTGGGVRTASSDDLHGFSPLQRRRGRGRAAGYQSARLSNTCRATGIAENTLGQPA